MVIDVPMPRLIFPSRCVTVTIRRPPAGPSNSSPGQAICGKDIVDRG